MRGRGRGCRGRRAVVAPGAGSTSRKGFTGIGEGDNVTANHYGLEPPDQGLAVNNNVAAEINNNVMRFFNATTGAPLTGANRQLGVLRCRRLQPERHASLLRSDDAALVFR